MFIIIIITIIYNDNISVMYIKMNTIINRIIYEKIYIYICILDSLHQAVNQWDSTKVSLV